MKAMIKGIDILLYSGETYETVSNVLVGNPVTSGTADLSENSGIMQTYTLAIPKGDTHNWVNRIVEFFGQKFRTVGIPLQGIEENIPLAWHKQVSVQKLDVSGICTIYEKDSYTRHTFENVYFNDARGSVVLVDGISVAGSLNIQIYADLFREDSYKPQIGDIAVLGDCDFEFDVTSQQSLSESMQEFRGLNNYVVVNEVKSISYGEIPDYILYCS